MKQDILVSISCITYNHATFIRQCLDGFLMQKTDFKFEVLIHDDASTDGTEEIIREYEAKFPDIIKPLYEKENQWSKGRRGSVVFNYPRAKGKYIALCEGDDYWTDPLKLQKQVNILEGDAAIGLVYTNAKILYNKKGVIKSKTTKRVEGFTDLLTNTISTLTTCFRRELLNNYEPIRKQLSNLSFGDYSMWLYFLSITKFYYLEDVTAVYRVLEESASHSKNIYKKIKFNEDVYLCQKFYIENIYTSYQYLIESLYLRLIIRKIHLAILYKEKHLFRLLLKENSTLLLSRTKKWWYIFQIIDKGYLICAPSYELIYKFYSKKRK